MKPRKILSFAAIAAAALGITLAWYIPVTSVAKAAANTAHQFGRADDYDLRGARIYDTKGPTQIGKTGTTARGLGVGDALVPGNQEVQGLSYGKDGLYRWSRLSSTALVDWNVTTKTTLYTCPTGKTCYVVAVIFKNGTGTSGTASCGVGWNAGGSDVVAASTNALTTITSIMKMATGVVPFGTAAGILGFKCGIAEGSAYTSTVDVYGWTE